MWTIHISCQNEAWPQGKVPEDVIRKSQLFRILTVTGRNTAQQNDNSTPPLFDDQIVIVPRKYVTARPPMVTLSPLSSQYNSPPRLES
jgi:hypothetical protein